MEDKRSSPWPGERRAIAPPPASAALAGDGGGAKTGRWGKVRKSVADTAEGKLDAAIRANPSDGAALAKRGLLYSKAGDIDRAAATLARAAQFPDGSGARESRALARAHYARWQRDRSRGSLQAAFDSYRTAVRHVENVASAELWHETASAPRRGPL